MLGAQLTQNGNVRKELAGEPEGEGGKGENVAGYGNGKLPRT